MSKTAATVVVVLLAVVCLEMNLAIVLVDWLAGYGLRVKESVLVLVFAVFLWWVLTRGAKR